jgi:hypothetical protein
MCVYLLRASSETTTSATASEAMCPFGFSARYVRLPPAVASLAKWCHTRELPCGAPILQGELVCAHQLALAHSPPNPNSFSVLASDTTTDESEIPAAPPTNKVTTNAPQFSVVCPYHWLLAGKEVASSPLFWVGTAMFSAGFVAGRVSSGWPWAWKWPSSD